MSEVTISNTRLKWKVVQGWLIRGVMVKPRDGIGSDLVACSSTFPPLRCVTVFCLFRVFTSLRRDPYWFFFPPCCCLHKPAAFLPPSSTFTIWCPLVVQQKNWWLAVFKPIRQAFYVGIYFYTVLLICVFLRRIMFVFTSSRVSVVSTFRYLYAPTFTLLRHYKQMCKDELSNISLH